MAKQRLCGFEARKYGVPPMGHAISTSDEALNEIRRNRAAQRPKGSVSDWSIFKS